ncbi:TPA: xanthine permease XanP [Escherichia coli]|nr:xanthine permease XanP [Escherichia coli]
MSDINHAGSDLIFELEDRPPFHQALVGAITHLLAIFVPMVTPALIVGAALQLSAETTAYLVSMAMIASGIGTWLQVNRYGIVGSGLLSIQSVNFSFVTVMIALGSSMKSDGFHEELIMSSLLGVSFVGAFLVVGSSFILPYLRRVITPTVSGIVVLMIGLSLIKVGIIDFGGGFAAKSSGTFGNYEHLGVGLLVLIVVIGFNCCRSPLLRMGGIAIGLCVGYIASLCLGMVDFSSMRNLPLITIPHPFKYGFSFSFHQFLVVGTIYLLSVLEAVGDITATAMVSRRPIQGEEYQSRLKGGFFTTIPSAVLGGAMTLMFSMIAIAGIRIIITNGLKRRETLIVATSLGLGLGVSYDPEIFKILPASIYVLVENPICAGGLTAILLNIILPGGYRQENVLPGITSAEEMD